ncbi:hypothetical protein AOLI_G00114230 [Acnodon oligacanthus]
MDTKHVLNVIDPHIEREQCSDNPDGLVVNVGGEKERVAQLGCRFSARSPHNTALPGVGGRDEDEGNFKVLFSPYPSSPSHSLMFLMQSALIMPRLRAQPSSLVAGRFVLLLRIQAPDTLEQGRGQAGRPGKKALAPGAVCGPPESLPPAGTAG